MNNRNDRRGAVMLSLALDNWSEAVIYGEPDGTISLDDRTGNWRERLYSNSLVLVKIGNQGYHDQPGGETMR